MRPGGAVDWHLVRWLHKHLMVKVTGSNPRSYSNTQHWVRYYSRNASYRKKPCVVRFYPPVFRWRSFSCILKSTITVTVHMPILRKNKKYSTKLGVCFDKKFNWNCHRVRANCVPSSSTLAYKHRFDSSGWTDSNGKMWNQCIIPLGQLNGSNTVKNGRTGSIRR